MVNNSSETFFCSLAVPNSTRLLPDYVQLRDAPVPNHGKAVHVLRIICLTQHFTAAICGCKCALPPKGTITPTLKNSA